MNGVLTLALSTGQQVAGTINLGTVGGTNTVTNLQIVQPVVTLPAGVGTVTILCGTTIGGTATLSSTASTNVTLGSGCSVPNTTLTLQGACNIPLASTISLPTNLSTTPIVVSNVNTAVPLTVSVPAGTGSLQVLANGSVVSTSTLSGTTQTITLPAICRGSQLSFNVNGVPAAQTLTVPASGSGSLAVTSFAQTTTQTGTTGTTGTTGVVPAPAKTGTGGLVDANGGFPWIVLGLVAAAAVLVGGTRVATGLRNR